MEKDLDVFCHAYMLNKKTYFFIETYFWLTKLSTWLSTGIDGWPNLLCHRSALHREKDLTLFDWLANTVDSLTEDTIDWLTDLSVLLDLLTRRTDCVTDFDLSTLLSWLTKEDTWHFETLLLLTVLQT